MKSLNLTILLTFVCQCNILKYNFTNNFYNVKCLKIFYFLTDTFFNVNFAQIIDLYIKNKIVSKILYCKISMNIKMKIV